MNTTMNDFGVVDPSGIRRQGKRLDEIALALALIMTGALMAGTQGDVPGGHVAGRSGADPARDSTPPDASAASRRAASASSWASSHPPAGIGRIIGQDLPLVPILLIILGVGLVVRAATGSPRPTGMSDAS